MGWGAGGGRGGGGGGGGGGRLSGAHSKRQGGLSPAAQWNPGIASASSESRAGSPAGGGGVFKHKAITCS